MLKRYSRLPLHGKTKSSLKSWQLSHLHMKATRKETIKWHGFFWSSQTFLHLHFPLRDLHEPTLCISLAHSAASFPPKLLRQAELPLNWSLIWFTAGRETNCSFSGVSPAEASKFNIHCPELTFTLVLCCCSSWWRLIYTRQCRTYSSHHLSQRESVSWNLVWKEMLIFMNGQSRQNAVIFEKTTSQILRNLVG